MATRRCAAGNALIVAREKAAVILFQFQAEMLTGSWIHPLSVRHDALLSVSDHCLLSNTSVNGVIRSRHYSMREMMSGGSNIMVCSCARRFALSNLSETGEPYYPVNPAFEEGKNLQGKGEQPSVFIPVCRRGLVKRKVVEWLKGRFLLAPPLFTAPAETARHTRPDSSDTPGCADDPRHL
jgi:hypothetical protein